jgi:hypothetical protein
MFRRRFWFRVIRSLALVYIGIVVVMMFFERSLVFVPTRYPGGEWQPSNLAFEDAEFTPADCTRLHGWSSRGLCCSWPTAMAAISRIGPTCSANSTGSERP